MSLKECSQYQWARLRSQTFAASDPVDVHQVISSLPQMTVLLTLKVNFISSDERGVATPKTREELVCAMESDGEAGDEVVGRVDEGG